MTVKNRCGVVQLEVTELGVELVGSAVLCAFVQFLALSLVIVCMLVFCKVTSFLVLKLM